MSDLMHENINAYAGKDASGATVTDDIDFLVRRTFEQGEQKGRLIEQLTILRYLESIREREFSTPEDALDYSIRALKSRIGNTHSVDK